MSALWGLAPEILLILVGAILPILGAFRVREGALAGLTVAAMVVAGYLTLGYTMALPGLGMLQAAVQQYATTGTPGQATFYVRWGVDAFSVFFDLLFLAVGALVALGSVRTMETHHRGEYYGLLTLGTVGLLTVASSLDLITLFVGLELSAFATYALASFYKREETSSEAGIKLFIVGSLSSAIALYGISLAYGLTGTVSFSGLAAAIVAPGATRSPMLLFMGVFLLAGFGFKATAVPFHIWAPDAYEGSPSPVSAWLSAGTKKGGLVALFKIFVVALIALRANWDVLLALVAVATMTVGNLIALRQDDVKRLLAYSSIAQAGYMLIGVVVATHLAVTGSLFHMLTHAIMKAGAFLAVAALAVVGVGSKIDDWRGLGERSPVLAFSILVFLVSLTGIPPLAGFASKFVLFASAISAGGWYVWLAVFGIVNSAISFGYYAKVMRVMYAEPAEDATPLEIPRAVLAAVIVAAVATIVIGLDPQPVIAYAQQAAAVLLST